MTTSFSRLFETLRNEEPAPELVQSILRSIDKHRKKQARMHFIFFSFASLVSFLALIPSINYFLAEFYQSGSNQYISLLFSDGSAILAYWQEFLLTIAESFPLIGALTVLTALFIFLDSLKYAFRDVKVLFS